MSERFRQRLLIAMIPGMIVIVLYNLYQMLVSLWFWFMAQSSLEQLLALFYLLWALFLVSVLWRLTRW